ncbi:MAG: hypothetical protein A2X94_17705 [Bdellovibrionales bacterium GWB1_55_8]|nr:MAG: hypothetical protein A2X94_17705 [Bdellovibrionales bacterium GWB1_55_8]
MDIKELGKYILTSGLGYLLVIGSLLFDKWRSVGEWVSTLDESSIPFKSLACDTNCLKELISLNVNFSFISVYVLCWAILPLISLFIGLKLFTNARVKVARVLESGLCLVIFGFGFFSFHQTAFTYKSKLDQANEKNGVTYSSVLFFALKRSE